MSQYWESETKRLQEELNDPLLRVEFNENTQEYEILKWTPRIKYEKFPGYLFGSKEEAVSVGIAAGYYSVQTSVKEWDGRIYKDLFAGRPERKSAKEIIQHFKENKEKVDRSREKDMRDLDRETIMDMHKRLNPTLYFYSKN